MVWLKNNVKKLMLLMPALVLLLAGKLAIAGYEAGTVRENEKTVPEFQVQNKEEETQNHAVLDNLEISTLPPAGEQTKAPVTLLAAVDEENRLYQDGTYYGTGTGFGGKLTVQVVIAEGKIASVSLVENEADDSPYIENALKVLQDILNTQSTNVDTVSGATYSSTGLIEAVRNALAQAVVSEDMKEQLENAGTNYADNGRKENQTQQVIITGTEEQGSVYQNGLYQGTAICYPDDEEEFDAYTLALNIAIINDKIVGISDIKGYGDKYITANDRYITAASEMADKIIAQGMIWDTQGNELNFDTVSGATCSSKAILEACKDAMKSAQKREETGSTQQPSEKPDSGEKNTTGEQETTTEREQITEPPSVEEGVIYANGTYSADVICYPDEDEEFEEYTLTLNLTVAGDKIVGITNILGYGEHYISDNDRFVIRAADGTSKYTGMTAQILEAGSLYAADGSELAFDAVSGATCSSEAIHEACKKALEKAKLFKEEESTGSEEESSGSQEESPDPEEETTNQEEESPEPEEETTGPEEESTEPEEESTRQEEETTEQEKETVASDNNSAGAGNKYIIMKEDVAQLKENEEIKISSGRR